MLTHRSGKWLMRAGDLNGDGVIGGKDANSWRLANGQIDEYLPTDINADGIVNNADLNIWRRNKSKIGERTLLK